MKNHHPVYRLLQTIRSRPAMYTGELTLKSLLTFTAGYQWALRGQGRDEGLYLSGFADFVAEKLGYSYSTPGIANMILAHVCGLTPDTVYWDDFLATEPGRSEQEQAIALFYRLLDEFAAG